MADILERKAKDGYAPGKTGVAYKVFRVKNGKLYPPMVANPGGEDTPIGVWLDAEEGELAGLSKTGRQQVKSTGSGTLSYRPGWHLGDVPRAPQFDRRNKETGEPEFPADFVWAECEYAMDVDYQPESDEQGFMRTKMDDDGNVRTYRSDKYQHSLAGLTKIPSHGYYRYRTNPRPDTVPWIITGQMKVNRLLDDEEVADILIDHHIMPINRQGGNKTLAELGIREPARVTESLLLEKTRQDLINKSKGGAEYHGDKSKGKNRWERRLHSRVATSVRDYNRIDMNAFWKGDILDFDINVHGETDDYVVRVTFENILKNIQDEVKRNNMKFEFSTVIKSLMKSLNTGDVYVSCTCPDWKYRMDWWAKQGRYDSAVGGATYAPKPEGQGGAIGANNLDDKGAGCKHVNLVLGNLSWCMKIASVINNYVKYCKDYMQRNYADYIFPQIYGMPYDKAVQLSLFDQEDGSGEGMFLDDKDTMRAATNRGFIGKDERGKFRKGNEYRFQKKPGAQEEEPEGQGHLFTYDNKRKTFRGPEEDEDEGGEE